MPYRLTSWRAASRRRSRDRSEICVSGRDNRVPWRSSLPENLHQKSVSRPTAAVQYKATFALCCTVRYDARSISCSQRTAQRGVKTKVKVRTLVIALPTSEALRYGTRCQGFLSFTSKRYEPYLWHPSRSWSSFYRIRRDEKLSK